jgi:osmotically-inducible protein OsmY
MNGLLARLWKTFTNTKGARTMNDSDLRQLVIDELEFEPSIDASNIGVAAKDGIVTLSGFVSSYAEKMAAERAVRRVKGVHAIAEEIDIRYSTDKKINDDEIARRCVNIIAWDTTLPDDKIKVKVERGWVTLSGEVSWHFQRVAAESGVRKISGVTGITNLLTIKPHIQASDIKQRIEEALKRSAEVEANAIRISVTDSSVRLEGRVHDWREREIVEKAAWSVPGVVSVDDRMTV